MTLVSIYTLDGKLRCELTQGKLSAEGEGTTFLGVLVKTYIRLIIRNLRAFTSKNFWNNGISHFASKYMQKV